MKLVAISAFLLLWTTLCVAQYADPAIPKPASGYGSDGPYTAAVDSFDNPSWPGHAIEIHHPAEIGTPVPTVFYSHAFGGNEAYFVEGMLDFLAMKGYASVFVPYQTVNATYEERYDNLLAGFRAAARNYPGIIDTTRVGFLGHSFGGGATFWVSYSAFTGNDWGSNGRFVYAMAPWYALQITQDQLTGFPADTKVLVEIFDNDSTNDHRMAIDLFGTIGVPSTEKDFLMVRTDTLNGYIHLANHGLPNTWVHFDALDYYAYYRLLDALCDYTWNGSLAGKDVALGGGSAAQVTMPAGMKPLVETHSPVPAYPESLYTYPCNAVLNPRADHCADPDLAVPDAGPPAHGPWAWPVPAGEAILVAWPAMSGRATAVLFDALGRPARILTGNGGMTLTFDLRGLPTGAYVLRLDGRTQRIIKE